DTGDGTDASMAIRGFASRFGMKGETDLGNGMTAHGKYEFRVRAEGTTVAPSATDGGTGALNVERRHATVGLKGDFGNIFLGQTYHTWYNMIVGVSDYPWWGNNQYWVGTGAAGDVPIGRTAQAISYAGEFGAVSVGATVYMDGRANTDGDVDDISATEIAVRGSFGDVGVGVGINSQSNLDEDHVGIAVEVPVGPVDLRANMVLYDDDTALHIYAGFGNFYLDYASHDADALDVTHTGVTLGYTHSIGPRTLIYFEGQSVDYDDGSDADTYLRAVLKYDIL
ncbi:MAG: porin, partial [Pseudomonadota bacterium]